jgi:hypothetical protein
MQQKEEEKEKAQKHKNFHFERKSTLHMNYKPNCTRKLIVYISQNHLQY